MVDGLIIVVRVVFRGVVGVGVALRESYCVAVHQLPLRVLVMVHKLCLRCVLLARSSFLCIDDSPGLRGGDGLLQLLVGDLEQILLLLEFLLGLDRADQAGDH